MVLRKIAPPLLFLIILVVQLPWAHSSDEWGDVTARRPWALGLTVQDKSTLEEGGVLEWSLDNNLTVVVTIPKINKTDNTIYLIVSAMTMSGTFLQVAAGLEPGQTTWSTYIMYVTDIYGPRKNYHLVAYRAAPHSAPGEMLSISIYSATAGQLPTWFGEVYNHLTGERRAFAIVVDGSHSFKAGGHEVIALESYTTKEEVFAGMGGWSFTVFMSTGGE